MSSNTDWMDNLIAKYDDWHECEEYHIHDGTGEHEGQTPLPHDFDDSKLKAAIEQEVIKARVNEVGKLYLDIANHDGHYVKSRCLQYLDERETELKAELTKVG